MNRQVLIHTALPARSVAEAEYVVLLMECRGEVLFVLPRQLGGKTLNLPMERVRRPEGVPNAIHRALRSITGREFLVVPKAVVRHVEDQGVLTTWYVYRVPCDTKHVANVLPGYLDTPWHRPAEALSFTDPALAVGVPELLRDLYKLP